MFNLIPINDFLLFYKKFKKNVIALLFIYFIIIKSIIGLIYVGYNFAFIFLVDVHEGNHPHAKYWRYLCPVVVVKDLLQLLDYLCENNNNIMFVITTLFGLFLLNEVVCQDRFLSKKIVSIYNLFLLANIFNPLKKVVKKTYIGSDFSSHVIYITYLLTHHCVSLVYNNTKSLKNSLSCSI